MALRCHRVGAVHSIIRVALSGHSALTLARSTAKADLIRGRDMPRPVATNSELSPR